MTEPRSVFITGTSTGIGAECALHLDRQGWQVFASVRREEDGHRLADAASALLRWLLLDVTDPGQIAAAAEQVARETGGTLHGLVNNAGIAVGGPMEYVPPDMVRQQFEVNVFSLVAVTQAFLPLLRKGNGRLVNIGSIAGRVTTPMMGPYCASKRAVVGLTDAFRMELAPSGLHVSVVEPGVVLTPIWDKGQRMLAGAGGQYRSEAGERYAVFLKAMDRIIRGARKRGVQPHRVARAVEHALAARRPRARYVIGRDARIRHALQTLLPVRWMDALILGVFRRLGAPR